MRRLTVVVLLALVTACARSSDGNVIDPAGQGQRRCGSASQQEIDDGLGSRTVTAGPVSMVMFRVSPAHSHTRARSFQA